MSCSFTEKISLLIDSELSPEEENQTRKHLLDCRVCQQAQKDFLLLGEQIKSFESAPDLIAERQSLQSILASKKAHWWQRQVRMPVPAFALLLIAMLALTAWTVLTRAVGTQPSETGNEVKRETAPTKQMPEDLSHYDRGARAVIYKVRREQPGATTQ